MARHQTTTLHLTASFTTSTMKISLLSFLATAVVSTSAFGANQEPTSIDLYCETMTTAFIEHALDYKSPRSEAHEKRIAALEKETLDHCKSMPAVGQSKLVRAMTAAERSVLTCVAVAEGIASATASAKEDRALYSRLQRARTHFEASCRANRKQFLSDMKTRGPEYTLGTRY